MNAQAITLRSTDSTDKVIRAFVFVLVFCMVSSVFLLTTMNVGYCTDDSNEDSQTIEDIVSAGTSFANSIYVTLRQIVLPCAGVGFAFAGFQFFLGGSQGAEKARKTLYACIGGVALVLLTPVLIRSVGKWFSGSGSKDLMNLSV